VLSIFNRYRQLKYQTHHEVRCLALERQRNNSFLFCGGLYSKDRKLIAESAKVMGKKASVVSYDTQALATFFNGDFERIHGEAIFLGILHNHFGHFLCDTLARLWIVSQAGKSDTFVFLMTDTGVPKFAQDFFALLGIADRVRIVVRPTLIDTLTIPDRAVIYPDFFHPDYLKLSRYFHEIQHFPTDDTDAPLFVSRHELMPGYSRYVVGERIVHQVLKDAGASIICPESLSIEQQFRIFNRHKNIVGYAGSAMHNLLFTSGNKNVLYYSGRSVPEIYRKIDSCLNNKAKYLSVNKTLGSRLLHLKIGFKPEILDLPRLLSGLDVFLTNGVNLNEYCSNDAYAQFDVEFNTASILRYIVEQKALGSTKIESEFLAYAKDYCFDREMIRAVLPTAPVLKQFFDKLELDTGWAGTMRITGSEKEIIFIKK
jgi:hypothetical protein